MASKKVIVGIVTSIIALSLIIVVLAGPKPSINPNSVKHGNVTLPITERRFYMGLVPTPKSYPNTTFADIVDAYRETGEIAEIVMVWSSSQGIGQYELLMQNKVVTGLRVYGLKPFLTLNFATIKQIPGKGLEYVVDAPEGVAASLSDPEFRRLWIEEAGKMAAEFKPDYLSLGNEVNDYFYLHPEDLQDYLTLVDLAYSAVKEVSPKTKVLIVFSLEHALENGQLPMIMLFEEKVDLIGLTTYPWKQYDKPEDIPDDYYDSIAANISKPIAFTEVGWPIKGSEDEQARFLLRFLELTEGMKVEMVNWLFLHQPKITGIASLISNLETATISLKTSEGTKRAVYYVWNDLKSLERK